MINAQITMTHPVSLGQPSHSSPRKRQGPVPGGLHGQPRPGTVPEPEDTPRKAPGIHLTPEEKREEQLQRRQQQLTQRQKQVNKNLKRIQRLSDVIRLAAYKLAQDDPNNDPNDLYRQLRPLLTLMGLANIINRGKTKLELGQTQGKDSLYCVLIRRENSITPDIIARIRRNDKQFNYIKWNEEGLEVYLWYPYKAPAAAPTKNP